MIKDKPRHVRTGRKTGQSTRVHTRRVRRIPGLWSRITVLAVVVAVLIVGMVGLILKAGRPYHMAGQENATLDQTRREVVGLAQQNAALQRKIAYLKTPAGIAEEAHQLGYMRSNEKPLVITGLPVVPQDDPALTDGTPSNIPTLSQGKPSLYRRFLKHLGDL